MMHLCICVQPWTFFLMSRYKKGGFVCFLVPVSDLSQRSRGQHVLQSLCCFQRLHVLPSDSPMPRSRHVCGRGLCVGVACGNLEMSGHHSYVIWPTCVGVACGILEVSRTVDSGTHNHAFVTWVSPEGQLTELMGGTPKALFVFNVLSHKCKEWYQAVHKWSLLINDLRSVAYSADRNTLLWFHQNLQAGKGYPTLSMCKEKAKHVHKHFTSH